MTEPGQRAQAPHVDPSVHDHLSRQFRDLFDSEFEYVRRSLQRLGVRPLDVDDVAQELFLTVHRALPTYDTARPMRPWLCGFSVRFAANYRRLGRLNESQSEAIDRAVEPGTDHEARDMVLKILSRLEFDRRAVVVMHDIEGFGAPEIARELDVPLNTIYSRLRLAREDLRVAAMELQQNGGPS